MIMRLKHILHDFLILFFLKHTRHSKFDNRKIIEATTDERKIS